MSAFDTSLLPCLVATEGAILAEPFTYAPQDQSTPFVIQGIFRSGEQFELTGEKYHAAIGSIKDADFLVSPTRGDTLTRGSISYVVAHVSNIDDAKTRIIFLRKP